MGSTDTTLPVSELVSFTPKQMTAYSACFTHRYILYGGARGGGKSRWLRWMLVLMLIYYFRVLGLRKVHVGLFCETYPDLRDRQISKISVEFPAWLGVLKETKEDGLAFYLADNLGAGVITLRNLDDPTKYQSAEFAIIAVDELTKNQLNTFNVLRGSLRWPGISHTLFLGGTNPGGVGHLWVKQLWIDRLFPSELQPRAKEFIFIRSLPMDNPYLDQSYWDELNSQPEDIRKAWVQGDWDVFAGQAFTGWRKDQHVVAPFELPAWWPRWRAVDWGYNAPFCCLWLCKNPDNGRIYVYRELYAREMTDRQQAKTILEMTPAGEKIQTTYADPSMWAKKTQEHITTTAREYGLEGVTLTQADNDRLSGKRKVDRMLMALPDGQPGLIIFSTCENLVRTLPALPYDKTNVEDIDTNAEDHAYDALRYGLTRATTAKPKTPAPVEPSPMERISVL